MPERSGNEQGDTGDNGHPRQRTPLAKLPSHLGPHCIQRHADVRKVAEHEHREQRPVHDLLRARVVRKAAAGGVDECEVDEREEEAHVDELEDCHVRLRAQCPACRTVRRRPRRLGVECLRGGHQ